MKTSPGHEPLTSEAITDIVDMWELYRVCKAQGKNPDNYGWQFPGRDGQRDYLLSLGLIKQERNCKCGAFQLSRAGKKKAILLNKLGFHSGIKSQAETALAKRKQQPTTKQTHQ